MAQQSPGALSLLRTGYYSPLVFSYFDLYEKPKGKFLKTKKTVFLVRFQEENRVVGQSRVWKSGCYGFPYYPPLYYPPSPFPGSPHNSGFLSNQGYLRGVVKRGVVALNPRGLVGEPMFLGSTGAGCGEAWQRSVQSGTHETLNPKP